MNPEILDRLLIDRACGSLSPDSGALLEAFLDKESASARTAEEIEAAVRLVKLASPRVEALPLPPLKLVTMPEPVQAPAPRRRQWRLEEIAAVFLLGVGLGFCVLRVGEWGKSQPERSPSLAGGQPGEPVAAPSFWSRQRLVSVAARAPAPATGPRLTWSLLHQYRQTND